MFSAVMLCFFVFFYVTPHLLIARVPLGVAGAAARENCHTSQSRVVNGPTSSGPNPARARKFKPEPEN